MTRFVLGLIIGCTLGYLLTYPAIERAKNEATRRSAQVSLYYCLAADMEDIIQKDHPGWFWWDAADRPVIDCDKVFGYWYQRNQQPPQVALLQVR